MWLSPLENCLLALIFGPVLHLLPLLHLPTLSGSPQFYISRVVISDFIKEVHLLVASGSWLPLLRSCCADEFRTWVKTALSQKQACPGWEVLYLITFLSPYPPPSSDHVHGKIMVAAAPPLPSPTPLLSPPLPVLTQHWSLSAGSYTDHLCVITNQH